LALIKRDTRRTFNDIVLTRQMTVVGELGIPPPWLDGQVNELHVPQNLTHDRTILPKDLQLLGGPFDWWCQNKGACGIYAT